MQKKVQKLTDCLKTPFVLRESDKLWLAGKKMTSLEPLHEKSMDFSYTLSIFSELREKSLDSTGLDS